MNSWLHADTGSGAESAFSANPGYSLYRVSASRPNMYSPVNIVFGGIIGKAEIYIEKGLYYAKTTSVEEAVSFKVPAFGNNSIIIDVILDGSDCGAGISKPVKITYAE